MRRAVGNAPESIPAFGRTTNIADAAGYTLAISEKPEIESVWMGRNMTPEGMKAKKTSFKISEVRAAITRHDALLAEIFSENYDRAIDRRPPNLACDYEYDHHGWD